MSESWCADDLRRMLSDSVGRRFGEVAAESKHVEDRWGREPQTITWSSWFGIVATRSGQQWGEKAPLIPAPPTLALLLGG